MIYTILSILVSIVGFFAYLPVLVVIADINGSLAFVTLIVLILAFVLMMWRTGRAFKNSGKPYHLLAAAIFAVSGILLTILLRPIILDIIERLFEIVANTDGGALSTPV